jgi:ribosome-associated toxin RatA of RatAB toxin-antitoxin module
MAVHLTTILVSVSLVISGTNNSLPWKKVHDEEGVVVWTRPVPGSDFVEMRAERVIAAPAQKVWAVVREPHRFDEFMPYTVKTRLIERFEGGLVVYTVTDPPIISRRDVTITNTIRVDESRGVYQLTFREANDKAPPLPDGVVRMSRMRGQWTVEKIDAERCRVQYVIHSEPGGMVPSWLANSQGYGELPEVLERMRKRVLNPGFTAP